MRALTALRWTGFALLGLSSLLLLPVLTALIAGEAEALARYMLTFILGLFTGAVLLIISRSRAQPTDRGGGMRQAILIFIVWWLVLPLIAALPFWGGTLNFADAWFEAVSSLTTTGAWLSQEQARASASGMVWRAALQWAGGLAAICAAASVFVRPVFIGVDIGVLPFSRGEKNSYVRALSRAFVTFTPVYLIMSLLTLVLLGMTGVPLLDSIVLALSLPASGGFLPSADGVEQYSGAARIVIFLSTVAGGISFLFLVRMLRLQGQAVRVQRDRETLTFLLLLPVIAIILMISARQFGFLPFFSGIFNAASMLSTNGFHTGTPPALVPSLITCMIGGAAISSAGGLKLLRWLTTFHRAGEEVWKLIYPQAVPGRSRTINEIGIWIHYLGFTVTLSFLVLLISISGQTLELSVTAATAAVSNAGPLIALSPGEVADYYVFGPIVRFVLALGMILGRLEMVVTLALFNRIFWRG